METSETLSENSIVSTRETDIMDVTSEGDYHMSKNMTIIGNLSEADINMTRYSEKLHALVMSFIDNRSLEPPAFWTLVILYSVLIVIGTIENIFVVTAVVRKPSMRTARNIFILNLAISDLLLCLITAPLTLLEIVSKHWPMPKLLFLCRVVGMLQGTSIFVSTITITAIALDRYQVIVYPTKKSLQVRGSMFVLLIIWLLAITLVSPIYVFRDLRTHETGLKELKYVSFCIESWPIEYGRAYYSAFSLVVQYLIPIIIVSSAYLKIYLKLKNRFKSSSLGVEVKKEKERGRKMQKTNSLLIAIAVVYGVSWLPLNLLNLVTDIKGDFIEKRDFLIIFAICHMMGMSSACSNPLLYGWLNDNFRKEFQEILTCTRTTNDMGATSTMRRRQSPLISQSVRYNPNGKKSDITLKTETCQTGEESDTETTVLAR